MYAVIVMKDGDVLLVYLVYETETQYYLGDWVFLNKTDIKDITYLGG